MDNKYQDLHIHNIRKNRSVVIRMLEIKQITFTEQKILINLIWGVTPMTLILDKVNQSITVD